MRAVSRLTAGPTGSLRLASLSTALLFSPPAWANPIVNGPFENPVVPVAGYTNFQGGSTAISAWQVVGVDAAVVGGAFTQSGITFQAKQGAQWVDLAGVTSNSTTSGLTQDIATIAGRLYALSFYVGSTDDGRFLPYDGRSEHRRRGV